MYNPIFAYKIKIMGQVVKDVTGEVYSRLTIIALSESRRTPRGVLEKRVLVQCECGVEKVVGYKDLKRGDTKSCGCLNREQKKNIVAGDIYSNWTILKEGAPYIYNGKKTRTFNARCVCGKEKRNINLTSLTSGKSKSCGCQGLPKKIKVPYIKTPIPKTTEEEQWTEAFNLFGYYVSSKGRIFSTKLRRGRGGLLETNNRINIGVNTESKKRIKVNIPELVYKSFVSTWNNKEYTLILIDDNSRNFSLDNLFLARMTNNGTNWIARAFGNMNSSGGTKGQRKKAVSINKKHLIDLYKQQEGLSYFLKLPMDLTGEHHLLSISVDRIDNEKDYEEGNINLVTRFENMGRRSATIEQMQELCKHLKYEGTL